MHTTRNELYKSARHFTYQTQNTKLMHNLPTRTILNVGISCFTNFPVVTERILWAGCLKNHKANEQNLTATTTASGPHLVSAASRESRDYARLEPKFCRSRHLGNRSIFLGGYVKARQMFFQRNGPLFFWRGVMKFWRGTNNFILGRCLRKLFFSDCIILQTNNLCTTRPAPWNSSDCFESFSPLSTERVLRE